MYYTYGEEVQIHFSEAGRKLTVAGVFAGPDTENRIQVEIPLENADFRGNATVGFGDRVFVTSPNSPSLIGEFSSGSYEEGRVVVSVSEKHVRRNPGQRVIHLV